MKIILGVVLVLLLGVGGMIVYFWEEYHLPIILGVIAVFIILGVIAVLIIWVQKFRIQNQNRYFTKSDISKKAKEQGGFNAIIGQTKVQIKNREASDNLVDVIKETVTIRTADGHGSGFVVNTDKGCLIITNNHVTGDHKHVQIVYHDGEEEYGRVEREGDSVDLALISFPNKYGRKGVILENELPSIGDEVFAIGSPLAEGYSNSVSEGIVINVNRVMKGIRYIQSDVTINSGGNGGPLVAKSNKVVGVTVLEVTDETSHAILDVNYFIPISEVLPSLKLSM